jgi:spermidine/putrescine transport system permease protein
MFGRRPQFLQVVPALVIFAVFFALPMSYFFVVSFWQLRSYKLVPDITFSNYAEVVDEYLWSAVFTLIISFLIAILTSIVGFMIAYYVRFKSHRYGSTILLIVFVTLFGGYLVKIYSWKTILGTQGILNTALIASGVIDEPVTWLLYSPSAVVITLVHFLLPFAVLPIYGSLRGIDETPLAAARDLGASKSRVFRDIILPQCQAGLFAAFTLSFLIAAGDYVTPRLVGGPNTFMAGNFVESQFINRLNAPIGSALSFSLMASCGLILIAVRMLMTRLLKPR